MKNRKNNHAFTLVELIVVIVILAILATIAFLSFSNQSSAARDSQRMTDLANIAKGLGISQSVGGRYPLPDRYVKINTSSGKLIGYQGEAGNNVLNIIKFSAGGGKDPLEKIYYTYSTNSRQDKYQALAFLENQTYTAFNPFGGFYSANATDYSNRYPFEKGDQMGIILSKSGGTSAGATTYTPLQDLGTISSSTGFVISDATVNTGMVAVISNGTGSVGVTVGNLIGYTTPLNFDQSTIITAGNQIKGKTDIYGLPDSSLPYIFDTGSYLVQYWASNTCNPANISVITKTDFSSPYIVPANTIVKIPNGTYNLSGNTQPSGYISLAGGCSAIIGESADGVILQNAFSGGGYRNGYSTITTAGNNILLLNLSIKGNRQDSTNNYSDLLNFSSSNSSLKNVVVFDGNRYGLTIGGNNDMIQNINSYNNGGYGINYGGTNNIINNSQSFNNNDGFAFGGQNNSFNNSLVYNNGNHGIYFTTQNSVIYNIEVINNGNVGLNVQPGNSANVFSTFQSLHNSYGLQAFSTGFTIYGSNKIFKCWSACDAYGITLGSGLVGWSTGTVANTGTTDCSNHSQPQGGFDWSSIYGSGSWVYTGQGCAQNGTVAFPSIPITSYIFGNNLQTQVQPVICPAGKTCPNGTNLQLTGNSGVEYDASKKIGQW